MPKAKPKPEPVPLETRLMVKRDQLKLAREQFVLQLNGIDNQLFLIDQMLNPTPDNGGVVEAGPTPEPDDVV